MSPSRTASLTAAPVSGALGAVISGLDLSRVTQSEEIAGLQAALAEHLVVFLPEQRLTLDDLERVTDAILAGEITVPIAATFPLEKIRDAVALQADRHVHGKIVITL